MHKILKAVIFTAVATMLLLPFSSTAFAAEDSQQISFVAHCRTLEDIASAVEAGAKFVSLDENVDTVKAAQAVSFKAKLIVDADSVEDAEEKYAELNRSAIICEFIYRIKDSADKSAEWAKIKNVKLIGYYKGNIYPIAVAKISEYGKVGACDAVLLQTNNQDGVILHNSVTAFFDKYGVKGMFSFADSKKSAKRTDTARSWDDLIARGYTVIETACPADFAVYLENNSAEREKLADSIATAKSTSTDGCPPNRVKTYNSALESAELLIADGTSATYAMADARAVLDEAVRNIAVPDGSKIQGDVEITAGRVVAALFGIALVLSWQIFFRKRWAKK